MSDYIIHALNSRLCYQMRLQARSPLWLSGSTSQQEISKAQDMCLE